MRIDKGGSENKERNSKPPGRSQEQGVEKEGDHKAGKFTATQKHFEEKRKKKVEATVRYGWPQVSSN